MAKTGAFSVIDFKDYKPYLESVFAREKEWSGYKTSFSDAIGIKLSFLSRVLKDKAHLSLEQAYRANQFLSHDEDEAEYFIALVSRCRAGTGQLRDFYEKQLRVILERKRSVKRSVKINAEINNKKKAIYYSSWLYSAVHMALTIQKLQSRQALKDYFNVSNERINEVISFLISAGLVVDKNGRLSTTTNQLKWDVSAREVRQIHTSWRNKSIEMLDKSESVKDFRYSAAVTVNSEDIDKIRAILAKAVGDVAAAASTPNEEELLGMNIDLFRLR